MDKRVRRIVMFCIILTVGLLLIFINITLIQLVLLLIALAVVLPFLLGQITISEVRAAFGTFKEQKLKKIGFLKKLDDIKLFEKTGAQKKEVPAPKMPAKPVAAPVKPAAPTSGKMPFSAQIGSLVATFSSLGTIIRERTRRNRKVTDINTMLDKTVSEKVEKSQAPAAAPLPAPGGAGSASSAETDPFLSLSGDEFDDGLLDGLDEGDLAMPGMPGEDEMPSGTGLSDDMSLSEPELSMPSLELDSAASDILKANAGDEEAGGFSGLEDAGDSGMDADFGDLDSISLDDVDLDGELDEDMDTSGNAEPEPAAAEPATAAAPVDAAESPGAVKTAWIPSDAPGGADTMEDQLGMQSDMAAFASSSGGSDEDLLSSIASDVKHTVKERDLSLLRELKDFKAPASEIEKELTEMYQRMNAVQKPRDKSDSATNEIK
jgi:hypothetical protein